MFSPENGSICCLLFKVCNFWFEWPQFALFPPYKQSSFIHDHGLPQTLSKYFYTKQTLTQERMDRKTLIWIVLNDLLCSLTKYIYKYTLLRSTTGRSLWSKQRNRSILRCLYLTWIFWFSATIHVNSTTFWGQILFTPLAYIYLIALVTSYFADCIRAKFFNYFISYLYLFYQQTGKKRKKKNAAQHLPESTPRIHYILTCKYYSICLI